MFSINPLSYEEWKIVLVFSLPVVLIDEVLKLVSRLSCASRERGGLRAPLLRHGVRAHSTVVVCALRPPAPRRRRRRDSAERQGQGQLRA